MKFNSKRSIALSFCLAILGTIFALPMRAEVVDASAKLVESNSEVNVSGKMPELNAAQSSKIFDESAQSNQQSLPTQPVATEDSIPVDSISVDSGQTAEWSDEIEDVSVMMPQLQEATLSQPVETVITEEQIPRVSSLPEAGTVSQLPQSSIAQASEPVFRSTRGGSSYIGIAGNFGITGDSDLGGRSLAIISKLGLSESFSVRPSVLFLSNFATFLIPITYDFAPRTIIGPDFSLAPYLGGGVAIKTGSDNTFGPLITAGVDLPISRTFTVNVAANLSFLRTTDLGLLVGIAYNF